MSRKEICENLKTIITQINETVGNRYEGINSTYIANIKPNSLRFVIEEAIKALEQEYGMREATKEERESVNHYIKSISKPTGIKFYEQEPKIGHWIMSDDSLYRPICDKCGAHPWKGYVPTVEEATEVFKFCPNCGARMAESEGEE